MMNHSRFLNIFPPARVALWHYAGLVALVACGGSTATPNGDGSDAGAHDGSGGFAASSSGGATDAGAPGFAGSGAGGAAGHAGAGAHAGGGGHGAGAGAAGATGTARTLKGRAITRRGLAAKGLVVAVNGVSSVVGDDGAFSLVGAWPADVPNYDLIALCRTPPTQQLDHPCEGVDLSSPSFLLVQHSTRLAPILTVETPGYVESIGGVLSGVNTPLPPNEQVVVASSTPAIYDEFLPALTSGSFSGYVRWGGAPQLEATFVGLHYAVTTEQGVSGLITSARPTSYLGFASTDGVKLGTAAGLTMLALNAGPVPASVEQTGSVTTAQGDSLARKDFFVGVGVAFLDVGGDVDAELEAPRPSFSFLTPRLPGSITAVCAQATKGPPPSDATSRASAVGCAAADANNAPLSVVVPAVPSSSASSAPLPAKLTWTGLAGATFAVVSGDLALPGNYNLVPVTILTDGGDASLPDLRALGLPLPSGTKFGWTATAVNDTSLDDVLSGGPGYLTAVTRQAGDTWRSVATAGATLTVK